MTDNILTYKHSKFGASKSHRWILCPGSVVAEEGLIDTKTSYAQEGNIAHDLAERMFFKRDYADLNVSDEMVEYVQTYIDYLNNILTDDKVLYLQKPVPQTVYYIEKRVDFSNVVPEGFGTADAIVINTKFLGNELHIIDFKYGKGVKVDAKDNTQLLLYALGALNTLQESIGSIRLIHLEIIQPRMNNFSKWTISFEELKVWEGYLKAKGEEASRPNAPRIPSDAACQWCKAFPTCPAPYEITENLPLLQSDLTEDEMKKILDNSKLIIKFVNEIEEKVYNTLSGGKPFKGYKLIEGKGIRKLKEDSEEKLVELLGSEAYDNKLLGILKLEKLLGKEQLNSLTYYSQCKPLLVKEDDKREAITLEELNYDVA